MDKIFGYMINQMVHNGSTKLIFVLKSIILLTNACFCMRSNSGNDTGIWNLSRGKFHFMVHLHMIFYAVVNYHYFLDYNCATLFVK